MFSKLCRLTCRATVSPSLTLIKQSRDMHCRKIVFNEFGDPMKVAELVEDTIPDKPDDDKA